MAIDFPSGASSGQIFEDAGIIYTYDGEKWLAGDLAAADFVKIPGDTMTGNLTVPSLNGGQLAGFRNVIINGDVTINQRGKTYSATSNNQYWADRWKKVSGGMTQIVESGSFTPNTVYTLSGTNVTTQQVTSPGSGNWTIPTVASNAKNVQLEPGTVATPFERRPKGIEYLLCLRYFWKTRGDGKLYRAFAYNQRQANDNKTTGPKAIIIMFPVPMRAVPTCSTTNKGSFNEKSTFAVNYQDNTETYDNINASLQDGTFDAEL